MRLEPILPESIPCGIVPNEWVNSVVQANRELYKKYGYQQPWGAYLAVEGSIILGTCAFKTPPQNGRVEIAYFTFPENEGRGVATKMAEELVRIAKSHDPSILVFAYTLPAAGASTAILKKLGFVKTKSFQHPEDGDVWEWELLKE